jgi:hypothetical protein
MDVFDQLALHAADWDADSAVDDAQLAQLSAFDLHDDSDGGQDHQRVKDPNPCSQAGCFELLF